MHKLTKWVMSWEYGVKSQKAGLTCTLPSMATACHSPLAATYKNRWLVVMGGRDNADDYLPIKSWDPGSYILSQDNCTELHHYLSHLVLHYQLSLVTCYLLGGTTEGGPSKKVFSVCLDDLFSQAISQPSSASAPPTPSPWHSPYLIHHWTTPLHALAFKGALLAVGGGEHSHLPLSTYQQELDQGWGDAYWMI